MNRTHRIWLHTWISPILIALLIAWTADAGFADPSPTSSDGREGDGTSYLVLGAVAAGFAATYALLLGRGERSHVRGGDAASQDGGGSEPPTTPGGGGQTPGDTEIPQVPPTLGYEEPAASPEAYPLATEAPEPGMWLLMASGAATLAASRWRRSR